jgi:hypothetical protein
MKKQGTMAHRVFDPAMGERIQLLPWSQPAKSLKNLPGGVETNKRGGVYQLEIVGFAEKVAGYTDQWYRALAVELLAICAELDIPPRFPRPFVAYPKSYGVKASGRMTGAAWNACAGIVGHQHVPESDHGDPGDLNRLVPIVAELLGTPASEGVPMSAADIQAAQGAINFYLPEGQRIAQDGKWGPATTAALKVVLDQVLAPQIRTLEQRVADLTSQLAAPPPAAIDARTAALAEIGAQTKEWVESVSAGLARLDAMR